MAFFSASRVKSTLARFARTRRGIVSTEFAMLAPMFFLVVFAVFEVSLITLSKTGLKAGLSDAARTVRTGNGQCLTDKEAIKIICRMAFLPKCESGVTIERERFPSGVTSASVSASNFSELNAGEIVLLRATYKWSIMTPLLTPFFGDDKGERALIESFVFKNEGFESASC